MPAVTINVCPRGCVCHAVREPASKETMPPDGRAPSAIGASNNGKMRATPVKYSRGASCDSPAPLRVIAMSETACA
jgi:hypothetical protein